MTLSVLHVCETLFLALKKLYRLRLFRKSSEENVWTKEGGNKRGGL